MSLNFKKLVLRLFGKARSLINHSLFIFIYIGTYELWYTPIHANTNRK